MQENEVRYFGYCQDSSGKLWAMETLSGAEAAICYVFNHRDCYPHVFVTDHRDCICLESVYGVIAFVPLESYFPAPSCADCKNSWPELLHQAACLAQRCSRGKTNFLAKRTDA